MFILDQAFYNNLCSDIDEEYFRQAIKNSGWDNAKLWFIH